MSIKNMLKHWRTRILGQDTTVLREIYWGQIYHDTIRNSDWFLNPSLSPGRWAVGYNYLYVLYRILDDVEPQFILEMGLGQSTKMIGQYAMHHESPGKIKHVVIEHDEVWEDFFFKKNRDLYKNTQLITLPLIDVKKEGESFKAYQNFQATIEKLNIKFHLLSVDGPLGSSDSWGRRDILPCLPECLDADFAILFDDFGRRKSTANTIQEVEKIFNANGIGYEKGIYPGYGDKGVCILTSRSWRFLTSL